MRRRFSRKSHLSPPKGREVSARMENGEEGSFEERRTGRREIDAGCDLRSREFERGEDSFLFHILGKLSIETEMEEEAT